MLSPLGEIEASTARAQRIGDEIGDERLLPLPTTMVPLVPSSLMEGESENHPSCEGASEQPSIWWPLGDEDSDRT